MTTVGEEKSSEVWRVLIVRRNRDEMLLGTDGTKFALPLISIPAHERIAANINRVVEEELGLHVVSLYEVFPGDQKRPAEIFYHAAVTAQSRESTPEGMYWTCVRSLNASSFSCHDDFAAIESFRSGLESKRRTADPFLKPNWFAGVTCWVEESLRRHSRQLTGPFQQLNASSTFSLIRFETDKTPVWFKAVGTPNIQEFPVTLALARVCPAFLSKILASKTEWNAWLAEEAPGTSLSSGAEICQWESAAASLAHLQILALPAAEEMCTAGARDLRSLHLFSLVAPFFEFLAECSRESQLQDLDGFGSRDFHELGAATQDTLTALDKLHLAESIGHMDLNPQNVFCAGKDCVFLDWAEAFVGCPFFSFEYLLQQFRQVFSSQSSLEARLRHAYVDPWRGFLSSSATETALDLCRLAALFAYAATLWSSSAARGSLSLAQHGYLLRLARKMRRLIKVCP